MKKTFTFDDVRKLAEGLESVDVATTYYTPALRDLMRMAWNHCAKSARARRSRPRSRTAGTPATRRRRARFRE